MITCKVIRKVSGNSIVTYSGTTFPAPAEPRKEPTLKTGREIKRTGTRKLTNEKPAPAPVPEVVKAAAVKLFRDYVEANPETGIPGENDTFQVVTLHDNMYNGYQLPFSTDPDIYPVRIVVNQDGEIMRTVSDSEKKIDNLTPLGWYVRTNKLGSEALNFALKDIKRLKTWQRARYQEPEGKVVGVKLSDKFTEGGYRFYADFLYSEIKKLAKVDLLLINDLLLSVGTLREILRIAKNALVTLFLDHDNHAAVVTYQEEGLKVRSVIKHQCSWKATAEFIPVI